MGNQKEIRLGPTTKRIFNLPKDQLLKHYALIVNKASSLSSAQRKTVEYRIGYGLNNNTIKPEEIDQALQDLALFVAQRVTETLNNSKDDSSTKEQ